MITFSQLGHYGRLGNQLFQIASTMGIGHLNNMEPVFPKWKYKDYFKGKLNYDVPLRLWQYAEMDSYFHEIYLDKTVDWDLIGYFQSWKYFKDIKPTILETFSFDKVKHDGVAIHVRRGDYLHLQHTHPVLGIEYYKKAMANFTGENFFVFSDGIEWCKENFDNVEFISTGSDISDFQAMAGFSKLIIANSSFSWWAAYLSESTEVIAPSKYVVGETKDDRIPPEWVKI